MAELERKVHGAQAPPLLFVVGAALLWSTGGLFIKWTSLSGLALSFWRSFFAAITVALITRHEGFRINKLTAVASVLYAVLLILFVLSTKQTTAANAIFLQYTAPVYLLILEPLIYKEKFRPRDLITVLICLGGMALFFVGQLRPQDVSGNLLALASGLCFALYFLCLRHPKAREVNRASSVIYGNILAVIVTAPWGLASIPYLTRHDAARREVVRRRHRLLYRAGAKSCLGVSRNRRTTVALGDTRWRNHHRRSHLPHDSRCSQQTARGGATARSRTRLEHPFVAAVVISRRTIRIALFVALIPRQQLLITLIG